MRIKAQISIFIDVLRIQYYHDTLTNAFTETAMGTSLHNLGEFQQQYQKAIDRMNELFVYR